MPVRRSAINKRSLAWGAICLFAANLLSRILGFLYRIMLVRLIGSEAIGLSEMVGPIYSFCLVAASCGLPMAMSRLISAQIGSKKYENIEKIRQLTLRAVCLWSAVITILAYITAPIIISRFAADTRILASFRAVTPAIFIVSICSCYRGYFQATRQISAIGFSQNIEQFIRVSLGLALSYWLLPYGPATVIIGISVATVTGELCGLGCIVWKFRRQKPQNLHKPGLSAGTIADNLLFVGIPLTGQRLLMSIILMLQAFIIPQLLTQNGLTTPEATAAYGRLTGVALTLLNLPGIFTTTLSTALLPAVAEVGSRPKLLTERINNILQLNSVIGLPIAVILYLYAEKLCSLLFNAPEAAPCLKVLAFGAWFIYTQTILNSVQQGLGTMRELFFNLTISGTIYITALYTMIPAWGILGAAAAFVCFGCSNCLLSFLQLKRKGIQLESLHFFGKPFFALCAALLINKTAAGILAAAITPSVAAYLQLPMLAVIYVVMLTLTGSLPYLVIRYLRR